MPHRSLTAVIVVAAALLVPANAEAKSCKDVHGDLSAVATSPLTTAGEIKTNHIKGSTTDAFTPLAFNPDGSLSYASSMTITTKKGTLSLSGNGTFRADGTFTETDTIVSGTGDYTGATGSLKFDGAQTSPGVFAADASGTLCG